MTKSASLVIQILAAAALLSGGCLMTSAQSGVAGSQHSMKGYELYSWRIRGEWHFALLAGTNRLKSRAEVTSIKVRVRGVEALKRRLDRLGEGEEVLWSAGLVRGTIMPPRKIIDEVRTYCDRRGVVLSVGRRSASGALNKSPNRSPNPTTSLPLNPALLLRSDTSR